MLKTEKLEVLAEINDTVWIGDEAVDLEATDIGQWYQSGDGYQLHAKQKASIIRWRALTPRELRQVVLTCDVGAVESAVELASRNVAIECVRYGLRSIAGLELARRRQYGVLGLTDETIDLLTADIFLARDIPETPGVPKRFWFLDWLGGLISRASFRGN